MVSYFVEDISFSFFKKRECTSWIKATIIEETAYNPKSTGNICIIFCSDDYLLSMNKQFLSHEYYTDVITFDNSEKDKVSGDIFISIDSVKSNADYYKQEFITELNRVIIHGVLHLLGFKDKTIKERAKMREREDFYLRKIAKNDR
jgi:rRNA maturation RNase YbeY